MTIRYTPIPTDIVRAFQAGGLDANGQVPERSVSDGGGNECRHCLRMIPEGAAMLVLAHRPFPARQPYAELGPIFLCAAPCEAGGGEDLPATLAGPDYIVRGYSVQNRIVYGTGAVTPVADISARTETLLADPDIAYVHMRSARNNCFQVRIDRA